MSASRGALPRDPRGYKISNFMPPPPVVPADSQTRANIDYWAGFLPAADLPAR